MVVAANAETAWSEAEGARLAQAEDALKAGLCVQVQRSCPIALESAWLRSTTLGAHKVRKNLVIKLICFFTNGVNLCRYFTAWDEREEARIAAYEKDAMEAIDAMEALTRDSMEAEIGIATTKGDIFEVGLALFTLFLACFAFRTSNLHSEHHLMTAGMGSM
jgi:hypothetical protein